MNTILYAAIRAGMVLIVSMFSVVALHSQAGLPDIAAIKPAARIVGAFGKLPLTFEPNHGQVDERVAFLSRSGSQTVCLTLDDNEVAAINALEGSSTWSRHRAARKSTRRTLPHSSLPRSRSLRSSVQLDLILYYAQPCCNEMLFYGDDLVFVNP